METIADHGYARGCSPVAPGQFRLLLAADLQGQDAGWEKTDVAVRYYHEDRTHLGLGKGTPNRRTRSKTSGRVLSQERLGGLHHRYDRAA